MSQTEDTELRDLVVEALEKNGALAKIRARLRNEICMALEYEQNTMKINNELSHTLSTSDGVLSLLLVQEFLEHNNLKFTTYLFKAEAGQGKNYVYDGRSHLADQFKNGGVNKLSHMSILTQILKCVREQDFNFHNFASNGESPNENCTKKEDALNATCIVHDNSRNSSKSNSDTDERSGISLNLNVSNSTENSISGNCLDNSGRVDSISRIITDETVGSLPDSSISENINPPSDTLPSYNRSSSIRVNGTHKIPDDLKSEGISEVVLRDNGSSVKDSGNSVKIQIKRLKEDNIIDGSDISDKNASTTRSVPEEIFDDISEIREKNDDTPKLIRAARKSNNYLNSTPKNIEYYNTKSPRSESVHYSSNSFVTSLADLSNNKIVKENLANNDVNMISKNTNSLSSVISELLPVHKNITIRGKDADSSIHSDSFAYEDFILESSNSMSCAKSQEKNPVEIVNLIKSKNVTKRKSSSMDNYNRSDSFEYNPDLTEEWQDD